MGIRNDNTSIDLDVIFKGTASSLVLETAAVITVSALIYNH